MITHSAQARFAGIIGNILTHYDTALYGLLAPFFAPLFFDNSDPLTALIATYAILPLGMITKPLGSLFFGWIGDALGRKIALLFSLLGMACVTFLMGFLPTYSHVGALAPCLLALGRMMQSFCAAGELTGSSIFVLENTSVTQRSLMSSFYALSSMSGIMLAISLVTFFCIKGWIEEHWRFLFWIGSATAFLGLFLRIRVPEAPHLFQNRRYKWEIWKAIIKNKREFIAIIFASGFTYTTYEMTFTLMNGFVPLVTTLSRSDLMKVHTKLLIVDMLLLPCFGYLAHRIGKEKVMLAGAMGAAIFAIPLFSFLNGANLAAVTAIRFAIIIFGVAFVAPFHAWKLEQIPLDHRYSLLSLGCTLGSQLIGAPVSVISLWLYQKLGVTWAPGLYLLLIGVLATLVVYHSINEQLEENSNASC